MSDNICERMGLTSKKVDEVLCKCFYKTEKSLMGVLKYKELPESLDFIPRELKNRNRKSSRCCPNFPKHSRRVGAS